jgi:predicted nucleotidyltransferase component of viral defense system
MLDLKQIESFYPEPLRPFRKNLLREYLQYKILEIIFDSKYGGRLCFMGGTAGRIVYANTRFSEDLDFDNLGLSSKEFGQLSGLVKRKLEGEGYRTETKNVFKGAYHSYIKISDILMTLGLSGHREEKLFIQLDAEPQGFEYRPEKVVLNKFDVFLKVNVAPIDILLAQKLTAILNRRRSLGRDFFDVVFLFGRTKPNFDYLDQKSGIKDMNSLKDKLIRKCLGLDFKRLAREVEPFLFDPHDSKKVLFFKDYLESLS